jgi:hypothetical protein
MECNDLTGFKRNTSRKYKTLMLINPRLYLMLLWWSQHVVDTRAYVTINLDYANRLTPID